MTASPWIPVAQQKPPKGLYLTFHPSIGPRVLAFHPGIGDPKAGGDFATYEITKRTTKFHHAPGVTHWMALPPEPA